MILILLICLPVFLFSCYTVQKQQEIPQVEKPASTTENENILFGMPGGDCTVLYRVGYVLCHDSETKVADWASYHLTDAYLASSMSRSDDFRADPDLPIGQRSELSDYKGSGYDRGHLVPAADMSRSQQTMSESFLLSNMTPQKPAFNRGIWKVLEEKVREVTKEKKSLYVITGPLFLNSARQTIGQDKVAVPSHFYKIIVAGNKDDPSSLQAVAFIIPNDSFPADELRTFIVTIDKVEADSHLDFFHDLPDNVENTLESQDALAPWFQN